MMKIFNFFVILCVILVGCTNSTEVHNRQFPDDNLINSQNTKLIVIKTYVYPNNDESKFHQDDSITIVEYSGRISKYFATQNNKDYYYKKINEKTNCFDVIESLNEYFKFSNFENYPEYLPVNINNIGMCKDFKYILKIYWRQNYTDSFKIVEDNFGVYENESEYPNNYFKLIDNLNIILKNK